MRNVKERLVSLLCDHTCLDEDCCKDTCNECLADWLIANGVTVAEDKNVLTNADRIRAMSDEELAKFVASKIVNLENHKMVEQGHTPTATQLSALGATMYNTLMMWLKQPAKEDRE